MRKFPYFIQMDQMDCGPTCLKMIAAFYGRTLDLEYLRGLSFISREGVSLGNVSEAAEKIGFHSLPVQVDFKTLIQECPLPCIVHWKQRHFIVVYQIKKNKILVADPMYGLLSYNFEEFVKFWGKENLSNGYALLLEPTKEFFTQNTPQKKNPSLRFLWSYFFPYKKYLIQLFLGLFVGSIVQLVLPFLTQAIVDYGINYQNLNLVYLILMAQLFLFISQAMAEIIRNWILLHITVRINVRLISDFLIKLMLLPISFFDSRNAGDIVQRINDHTRIQNFLSSTSLNTLFSVINILVFGIVLAYYNFNVFLLFILGSFSYLIWVFTFMKKRAILDFKHFEKQAENQNKVFQLVTGIQEIKLNRSEKRRRSEWEEIQGSIFQLSRKSLVLEQYQNGGGIFINEVKNILITFIAAKSVIQGDLTLGMMLSIQYIIGQMNVPLRSFATFFQAGQDAKLSLERLIEIHGRDNEDEISTINSINTIPENRDLSLNNVSFAYGNSIEVLKNLSFSLPSGKVTAIVGPSGSGKSTLIKLLLKFYPIRKGVIKIGDINLNKISTKVWRQNCGAVMQDGFIFGDSILRNITESNSEKKVDELQLRQALMISNLEPFIDTLPSGVHTVIGSTGIKLSGGQEQRILLARAIYKDPTFFIMDEATSALDSSNERIIMQRLEKFYQGRTVIVVAHRLSTVKNADNIIVMDKGSIVESGTHELLINNRSTYYHLIKDQLELGN